MNKQDKINIIYSKLVIFFYIFTVLLFIYKYFNYIINTIY